ncbi:MAG TPA: lamin tail domain-containing protein [Polyangiales bacterium]|nr:lamin tail domain-containing protein [Polyangiales bacterium]
MRAMDWVWGAGRAWVAAYVVGLLGLLGLVGLVGGGCVETAAPAGRDRDVSDGGRLYPGEFGRGPDRPSASTSLAPRDSGVPVTRVLPSESVGQGGRRAPVASALGGAGAGRVAADGGRAGASMATRPGLGAADGGAGLGLMPSRAGVLVISELMVDPKSVTDADGEWFELFNPTAEPLDLTGCEFADGSEQRHPISAPVVVPPHASVTVARTDQPGFAPDIVASFSLKNGADVLELVCGAIAIDRVEYDKTNGFPVTAGIAMSLDARSLDAERNDLAETWCLAVDAYSADFGTPGQPNPECGDDGDAGIFADALGNEFIDSDRDP